MSAKVELRVTTSAGHSIKVKVPPTTTIGKLQEKMLPNLKQLVPDQNWAMGNYFFTCDGKYVDEKLRAEALEGKALLAVVGRKPGGSPKARVAAPPANETPQPAAKTPIQPIQGNTKASENKERGRSKKEDRAPARPVSPASSDRQDRIVLTVNFRSGGHINFKLNPRKTTFAKLKELVENNSGKEGRSLRFKRDNEYLELAPNDKLADAGITHTCSLECIDTERIVSRVPSSSEGNRSVHLVVEGVGGQRLPMVLSTSATIASIARTIDDTWGVPMHMVGVVWLGRMLSHSDTVGDCGLTDGIVLQIVNRTTAALPAGECNACGGTYDTAPYCPSTGKPHRPPLNASEPPTTMLKVKSQIDGKEYRFPNIRLTATITKIKTLLAQASGVPIHDQVLLTADGREVSGGFSLKDSGLLEAQPALLRNREDNIMSRQVISPPPAYSVPPTQYNSVAYPHLPLPPAAPSPALNVYSERSNTQATPQHSTAVLPFDETETAVLQSMIEERIRGVPPRRETDTGLSSFSLPAPAPPVPQKKEESFNERTLLSQDERVRELNTEYRMKAAREDTTIEDARDKYGIYDEESMEASTMRRMEAARRTDLLKRRNDGQPLIYRPLIPGVGLEDPGTFVPRLQFTDPSPQLHPLSDLRRTPHEETLALPCSVTSPYKSRGSVPRERIWDR